MEGTVGDVNGFSVEVVASSSVAFCSMFTDFGFENAGVGLIVSCDSEGAVEAATDPRGFVLSVSVMSSQVEFVRSDGGYGGVSPGMFLEKGKRVFEDIYMWIPASDYFFVKKAGYGFLTRASEGSRRRLVAVASASSFPRPVAATADTGSSTNADADKLD